MGSGLASGLSWALDPQATVGWRAGVLGGEGEQVNFVSL